MVAQVREKEEEAVMLRRQVIAAWRPCGQQCIAVGANQFAFVQRLHREMGAAQGQMPGRDEGRGNSEDE